MILITGATGRTGSVAARELAARGVPVRALVRDPGKAASLQSAGVEIAVGDAGDVDAVRAALRGVTGIAIILPNGEPQLALETQLATLAVEAGATQLVKMSSLESLPDAHNPVHQAHWQSEQHIRALGVPWTMVRPSFYMQNFLSNAPTIKAEGRFYYPFGERGAAVLSDARDAGYFVAHVLSTPGHGNRSYDVTSPDRVSFHEVAQAFTRELGRKVEYVPRDPAEYRAHLARFLKSSWHLDAVCGIFAEIAAGYVARTTDTFREVTGREPTTLVQFIREHLAAFRA